MNDKILQLIIRGVDDASATITRVGTELGKLGDASLAASAKSNSLSNSFQSVGKSISSAGAALLPMSLAAGAALGVSAKFAMDFNQSMEMVHTQAGASQQEVENLKQKVLDLAPAVGFGPDKLAQALYHVESVGYRGADAMAVLRLAAEGAAVGQANLDDTTYALTSTMKSFNLEGVQAATKTMGELNAIVGSGDMKMQDLNAAIQTGILSTAQTFGVDIQSMGGALSYLTDRGEKADVASTRLSMGLTLMAAPTAKAAKLLGDIGMQGPAVVASSQAMTDALRKAGLTTVTLADDLRKPDGIQVALLDLKTHLEKAGLSADDSAALMARAFGGGRTDKALMALIQNLAGVKQKYDAIGAGAGNFAQDWAAQQQQANQQWNQFVAQLQVVAVKLGTAFLPAFTSIAKEIGKFADGISKLSPGQIQMIADSLLAIVVLGPALKIVGGTIKGFGDVLTAASAVKQAVITSAAWIASATNSAASWLISTTRVIVQFVLTAASAVKQAVITSAAWIASATNSAANWLISTTRVIVQFVLTSASAVVQAVITSTAWIVSATTSAASWLISTTSIIGQYVLVGLSAVSQGVITVAQFVLQIAWAATYAAAIEGIKLAIFAWTGAQWLLNFAMDANPIGLLMLGIAALIAVAALIVIYWQPVEDFFGGLWKVIGNIMGAIGKFGGGVVSVTLHALHVPGFASGVQNFSGGMALVGEQGPELVELPRGANVHTNSQSQGIMNSGGGSTTNIYGNIHLGDSSAVESFFARIDRNNLLARKGLTTGSVA